MSWGTRNTITQLQNTCARGSVGIHPWTRADDDVLPLEYCHQLLKEVGAGDEKNHKKSIK